MMKEITIKLVNSERLSGAIFTPDHTQRKFPAILFIHGWMSGMKGSIPRAEALVQLGYICLLFDLRGHGKSDGKLGKVTLKGSLEDAMAAYDYLVSLPEVDKEQIAVVGQSYGGYIAALLTQKRDVSSLVLRAPAIYRDEIFEQPKVQEKRNMLRTYRQSIIKAKDNYALQAISHIQVHYCLLNQKTIRSYLIRPLKIIETQSIQNHN